MGFPTLNNLTPTESLGTRTSKLKQDYDEQLTETSRLISENEELLRELKTKESNLAMNRSEVRKVNKIKEVLIKKNRVMEEQKVLAEHERKMLRQGNVELSNKIDRLKKEIEVEKKNIEDLTRERDIINQNYVKTHGDTQKQVSASAMLKQTRHNLDLEIARYKRELEDHQKEIEALQNDKTDCVQEAITMQEACVQGLAEIKERELQLYDYKKQLVMMENKLKHQQNLYESVQSERNLHSKHLIEAQADIADMKRTLKIMNFSINGYKEDIHSKDQALAKEISEANKLNKDIETIQEEIKTLKNQNELGRAYIKTQAVEQVKLSQFVKEAEDERARQEKALAALIGERDNLSSQLMHQNDELSKVYNKIKTQQCSLNRGEIHYRDKCKLIRTMRLDIHELKSQHRALSSDTNGLGQLKSQLQLMESELVIEKIRLKALEEELENPINVHRWRKMEGSNPQEFELIQMIQTLQKKLIAKSKEDKEKEAMIGKKEELYLHLKGLLAKQVGPEALEQMAEFETVLKDKNLQLKHMGAELNMYQAQVREYRYAIENLDKSIEGLKKEMSLRYKSKLQDLSSKPVTGPVRIKSALKKTSMPDLTPVPATASEMESQRDTEDIQSQQIQESEQPSEAGMEHPELKREQETPESSLMLLEPEQASPLAESPQPTEESLA